MAGVEVLAPGPQTAVVSELHDPNDGHREPDRAIGAQHVVAALAPQYSRVVLANRTDVDEDRLHPKSPSFLAIQPDRQRRDATEDGLACELDVSGVDGEFGLREARRKHRKGDAAL